MAYLTYKVRKNKLAKPKSFSELKMLFNTNPISDKETTAVRKITYITSTTLSYENVNGLEELKKELDVAMVYFPSQSKHKHFETFEIPKKSGGTRTIQAPDDDIKTAYTIVKNIIEKNLKVLPHDNAWAYTEGRSVLDAVKQHQQNESKWFLKVDITKFFDNCTSELIIKQLLKVHPFNHVAMSTLNNLAHFAVLDDALPQGTPLSPLLTNLLMVPFDHHFSKYCEAEGFIYTRYADDIIISHKDTFNYKKICEKIEKLFEKHEYPFTLKKEKTRYGSVKGQNWNLGLMLNKDNNITLGHKFKKQLKVVLHKLYEESLPTGDPHIMGLFSYLKQIEPIYYGHLEQYSYRKYQTRLDILITGRI